MMYRPYRNVPTPELRALYMSAVQEYDTYTSRGYYLVRGPIGRLMEAYARELHRRRKESA